MTHANGDVYEGQWLDDRANGFGIFIDVNSEAKYEGYWMDEYSEAVGSVVKPLPLINVSVGMSHSTAAICLSTGPHSLVFAAVGPELHTDAFSLASLLIPLPLIELALSHVLEFVDIYTERCFFFQLAMETATDFAEC